MPLFEISGSRLSLVRPGQFDKEKSLQTLINESLSTDCLASITSETIGARR